MDTKAHAAGAGALDPGALDAFTGGDPAIAREIYVDFVKLGRIDLALAREAIAGRDSTALARAAHRIKGSSRMIGALPASDAAHGVEHATRNGDWPGAEAGMPEFERALAEVFALIETRYAASA